MAGVMGWLTGAPQGAPLPTSASGASPAPPAPQGPPPPVLQAKARPAVLGAAGAPPAQGPLGASGPPPQAPQGSTGASQGPPGASAAPPPIPAGPLAPKAPPPLAPQSSSGGAAAPRAFADMMRGARPSRHSMANLEESEPAMPEGLLVDGVARTAFEILASECPGRFADLEDIEEFREHVLGAPLWTFEPDEALSVWAEVLESLGVDGSAARRLATLAQRDPRMGRAEATRILAHLLKPGTSFQRGPSGWVSRSVEDAEDYLVHWAEWEGRPSGASGWAMRRAEQRHPREPQGQSWSSSSSWAPSASGPSGPPPTQGDFSWAGHPPSGASQDIRLRARLPGQENPWSEWQGGWGSSWRSGSSW